MPTPTRKDLSIQQDRYRQEASLDAISELCARRGSPERACPVIHVAGTNGKGSVVRLLAHMLGGAKLRIGMYTSPSPLHPRFGIQISNKHPSEHDYNSELERITQTTDERATRFDIETAVAFGLLARAQLDLAIIEVGLGGRHDSTNIVQPLVCVITPISDDHRAALGDSLAEIAHAKAGIIKQGVPVVIAPQPADVMPVLLAEAEARPAPVHHVNAHWRVVDYQAVPHSPTALVALDGGSERQHIVEMAMLGLHQAGNLATALTVIDVLVSRGYALRIDEAVRDLKHVRWPGRFELWESGPQTVLDSAHNPAGMLALAAAWQAHFPAQQPTVVLGVSGDKDVTAMLAHLKPIVADWVCTQASHPRAMPASILAHHLRAAGIVATVEADVTAAIEYAQAQTRPTLICGSIFLADEARRILSAKDSTR